MQAMYLMVAAVVGMQQPLVPRTVAPALAQAQAALQGWDALDALDGLHALDALDALDVLDGLDALDALDMRDPGALQDEQDPTDSLWRAARGAFNRGDYASAAKLYGDLARRYPDATRAGDALYWAAFALYKNDNLVRARDLLVTQQQRYPKAATLRDGDALLARIQSALATQGDEDAHRWVIAHADLPQAPQPPQPPQTPQTPRPAGAHSCPDEDDEDDVRVAALNGLLQMDATNALPILKKVLAKRDGCSAGLRRKAVFIVSQKRSAETEDILLDVARNDPESEVRQQAVFWLSQVGSDRAVTALDSILRSTTDPELREKALFALSQIDNARAAQILRDYAANERAPEEAREKAIFWLGQRRSPENAAFLRGMYAKLTGEDLKEKVIFSLSQMGGADNGRWLMDIALNEREPVEMRKKALFWVGQTGGNLDQLAGLYDRMQNQEMKEQLIFVYSQRHEAAALDQLIRIAKTEQNKELRKKAIFWLGQSHDPRAAQVLLEIINP
ncbi:MAG TPA: HEAT repeat domain-containing protein [Gemmatimonadales bacterium]|nr:HEAT repeat domain-containing protein [Gemmatimonadales bacterium]